MSSLKDPSSEQLEIINNINNHNIIADCVAGSGKTTSVLHICLKYPESNIILITYNSKLKLETRERIGSLNIKNCIVHTYHSFNMKFYLSSDYTDLGINNTIKNNTEMIKQNIITNMIIFDEVQDMTEKYYEFGQKIIKDINNIDLKICLLGDVRQCIYQYNGADSRYLSMAQYIYNTKFGWKKCVLSTSYRLTNQISNFINLCVLKKQDHIKTIKNGNLPKYFICDTFTRRNNVGFQQISILLQKYGPNEIFVLAPSVKKGEKDSPVRITANLLSENGIPIYVPISDEESIDSDIIKNKILFCTFHQSKGLEREAVVIYNFDNSYFKYYNKDPNINVLVCPNIYYVALTRCKSELILLHDKSNDPIDFLIKDTKILKQYTNYNESHFINNKPSLDKIQHVSVTEYIKNIKIDKILVYMDFIKKNRMKDHIKDESDSMLLSLTNKIQQNGYYETVSEINAIAITAYNEYMTNDKKNMTIYDEMNNDRKRMLDLNLNINPSLKETGKIFTINDILYLSNMYTAYRSGYIFKTKQILEYNWLTDTDASIACDRFNGAIDTTELYYEIPVLCKIHDKYIIGAIDMIDMNNFIVYEFKCVNGLQNEHFLQLIMYSYLLKYTLEKFEQDFIIDGQFVDNNNGVLFNTDPYLISLSKHSIFAKLKKLLDNRHKIKYILWNIMDNVMYEIKINDDNYIITDIYNNKFGNKNVVNYNFLDRATQIMHKYNPPNNKFTVELYEQIDYLKKCRHEIQKNYDKYMMVKTKYYNTNNNKIIVLDTETTGYAGSRMTQLCYLVYNDNKLVSTNNFIIKPNGFTKMSPISKFSYEYAMEYGNNINDVLDNFYVELITAKKLVIHNSKFDIGILIGEFQRVGNNNAVSLLNNCECYCTMNKSKKLLGLMDKRNRIKNPRLEELYVFLFGEKPDESKLHDALYDTECLAKCFFLLRTLV